MRLTDEEAVKSTVIRIPLRTDEQAKRSKIKAHAPRIADLERILKQFCEEIEGGGLLFLKSVVHVVVRIDDVLLLDARLLGSDAENEAKRASIPGRFRTMYSSQRQLTKDDAVAFDTEIRYTNSQGFHVERYAIQHLLRPTGTGALDEWARDSKLFPWVAIAAPIKVQPDFSGRLFSTLRLPIRTMQPVQMHGLFAIAPDRARLGFDESAVSWNSMMFRSCISLAWTLLLEYRAAMYPAQDNFGLWPNVNVAGSLDLWCRIDDTILDLILRRSSPVWFNSRKRFVSLSKGFFASQQSKAACYVEALTSFDVPSVVLEENLFNKLQSRAQTCRVTIPPLRPDFVRVFLYNKSLSPAKDAVRLALEFLLSDIDMAVKSPQGMSQMLGALKRIAIWPTLAGTLVEPEDMLLPRDTEEMRLFIKARPAKTIDLQSLSGSTVSWLSDFTTMFNGLLRRREPTDLTEDLRHVYPLPMQSEDKPSIVNRDPALDRILRDIWIWLRARSAGSNSIPASVAELQLLPLTGSRIRRLHSSSQTHPNFLTWEGACLQKLFSRIAAAHADSFPALVDYAALNQDIIDLLRKNSSGILGLARSDEIGSLCHWLYAGQEGLKQISTEDRRQLLRHLCIFYSDAKAKDRLPFQPKNLICRLPIFSRTKCEKPFEARTTDVGSIEGDIAVYELPEEFPPIPDIQGVCLCDLSDTYERRLLSSLEVVGEDRSSRIELLLKHIIPWMLNADESIHGPAKQALASWIIANTNPLDAGWISQVLEYPIIPVASHSKGQEKTYRRLKDLVDPTSHFKDMFYLDENLFPDPDFFEKHKSTLQACKLADGLSSLMPIQRARVFAKRTDDLDQLMIRVATLFSTPLSRVNLLPKEQIEELRSLKWIPGRSPSGERMLLAPSSSRGKDVSHLIDKVWGYTSLTVEPTAWRELLGWDQRIPNSVLLQQLDTYSDGEDVVRVEQILRTLDSPDPDDLLSRKIILGHRGGFYIPANTFYPGNVLKSHSLAPYIDRIDPSFAKRYKTLIGSLNLKAEPSLDDLRWIQDQLCDQKSGALSQEMLNLAVATLEVAASLDWQPEDYSILLVPTSDSLLVSLCDAVHGDWTLSTSVTQFNCTHPAVSRAVITKLGIEGYIERATRLEIDLEDEDGDEYIPRESLTTVITDTLDRYRIDSTFNEYLANADDAGASSISWILDDVGDHPTQSTLTEELGRLQGPALFVHNDSIFTDKDLEGFRDIGQGGKTQDVDSTGKFGRGALTMYHFTDVPSLVSAGFFIVLDPLQEHLTRRRNRQKKVGLKLSLSKARSLAPDLLSPFVGVKGFDQHLDYYEGTIFRFPLRNPSSESLLVNEHVDEKRIQGLMQDYLKVAQSSLLFLTNANSIEFQIRSRMEPEWTVIATRSDLADGEVFQKTIINVRQGQDINYSHEWQTSFIDVERKPTNLSNPGRGNSKVVECGIAALVNQSQEILSTKEKMAPVVTPENRVFCRLPTTITASLPVSFHASFAITGDRKNITFIGQDPFAQWNRWLAEICITDLYYDFLNHLASRLGQHAFKFWPRTPLPSGKQDSTLSEVIARSFWARIANHASDGLLPCVDQCSDEKQSSKTDLRKSVARKRRKLHPTVSLDRAYFDLQNEQISQTLRPILSQLSYKVVRPPPGLQRDILKLAKDQGLSVNDASLWCEILKEKANSQLVDQYLAAQDKNSRLKTLVAIFQILQSLKKVDKTNRLQALDGCNILPRLGLDRPLGKLRVVTAESDNIEWYLQASLEEMSLFDFAADHMVHSPLEMPGVDSSDNLLACILGPPFNNRALQLEDIGSLLRLPGSPLKPGSSLSKRDKWVSEFWDYVNAKCDLSLREGISQNVFEKADMRNVPILRYKNDDKWCYVTPKAFEEGPYILEPIDEQHVRMLRRIPGLCLIDRFCTSTYLQSSESDYRRPEAFGRFLKAIQTLHTRENTTKQLLEKSLQYEDQEHLRSLVCHFLSHIDSKAALPERSILRQLPVWPRLDRPEHQNLPRHIAAEDAFLCSHQAMFLPCVKGLENFVDPKAVSLYNVWFKKLGCSLLSVEEFWKRVRPQLPRDLTTAQSRKQYYGLVETLVDKETSGLQAPCVNGSGVSCDAKFLYDHEVELFRCAFVDQQEARFIHRDLRRLRPHWISQGLRTQTRAGVIRPADYLECMAAVAQMAQSFTLHEEFEVAAAKLSNYLTYENQEMRQWPGEVWDKIFKAPVFEVDRNPSSNWPFREKTMQSIAGARTHRALNETGRLLDLSLFWSQLPVVKNPPVATVYDKRPLKGKPSVSTVYEHLKFLVYHAIQREADVSKFLADVKSCYNFLQDNTATTVKLPDIKESKIWFNLPSTNISGKEDLASSLLPAQKICFNSPGKLVRPCHR